jgi:hypothetical protein
VLQIAVVVPQAQDEAWSAQVARNTDDNAVGGALLFDLYPAALAGQITAVVAFGHHTFNARHQPEPVRGLIHIWRLDDQLQARIARFKQRLEMSATGVQGHVYQACARVPQQVESKQYGWIAHGGGLSAATSRAQPGLQCAEVRRACGVGDDDLAVE